MSQRSWRPEEAVNRAREEKEGCLESLGGDDTAWRPEVRSLFIESKGHKRHVAVPDFYGK